MCLLGWHVCVVVTFDNECLLKICVGKFFINLMMIISSEHLVWTALIVIMGKKTWGCQVARLPMATGLRFFTDGNTLRPRQNGRHFFRLHIQMYFLEWKSSYFIHLSPKLVPKCPINNNTSLVQTMASRWAGNKPLSEQMMVHCTDTYMRHSMCQCVNSIS